MNKLFFRAGLFLILANALVSGPAPVFLNEGQINGPLSIDATQVINLGTMNIPFSVVSFETRNTLVYTNRGNITATPGINFLNVNDAGARSPSASFYNGPGATISAEFSGFTGSLGPWENPYQPLYGGFVGVYATNIVNRGTIKGFYSGDIQIHGVNVDLASSRLGEGAIPFSTYTAGETNFFPETDLRDQWWRYSETGIFLNDLAGYNVGGALIVQTPQFRIYRQVNNQPDDVGGPYVNLRLDNPLAFVAKLQPSETNQQFEIVFVSNPDPAVDIDVSWEPGRDPNFPAYTAFVRFTTIQPDLVSQGAGSGANQFVIEDTFGSNPNEVLQLNVKTGTSQKPFNLSAYRAFPPQFIPGVPIGSVSTNSDFYEDMFTKWFDDAFPDGVTMTNLITTNRYATWAANLERYPSSIAGVSGPGGGFTNLAGRVMISGQNLNLSNARIQGQSLLSIQTDNLISSRGAVIDAPILNLDLATKNGNLVVQDLAKGSPSRFGGDFRMWSTTFTNFWSVTGTNASTGGGTPIDIDDDGVTDGCDTDGDGVIDVTGDCPTDTGGGTETTTNYTAIYHVTVIQNTLTSGVGIFLNDLKVRGTNVDLRDEIRIDRGFAAAAENLTVSGSLNLVNQNDLTDSNLPGLLTLTNSGTISAPGFIGIGISPSPKLNVIANLGAISSAGISLGGTVIENSGSIQASGGNVQISAGDYVNNGGSLSSLFDSSINASNAVLSGIQARSQVFFNLNVSGNLSDGGTDFPGVIEAGYGINLLVKPATGNLLGTTVNLTAPEFGISESYWAAADLGPTQAGYQDNAALGVLSLDIAVGGVVSLSQVDSVNAMYVERLELSDLIYADLENALILSEGMTLYYTTTSDNVTPEELDGFVTAGGGTLRWVKDGSGSGGAELVTVRSGDGRSLRVPKALRFSQTLDSDGDGVMNASDTSPFDLVVVSQVEVIESQPPFIRVVWMAAPGQTYEVQGTSDLKSGGWSAVKQIRNTSNAVQRTVFEDPVDPGSQAKSYRVIVNP